jgi:sugar phosphate permease
MAWRSIKTRDQTIMTTMSLEAVSTVRSNAYRKTAWRLMPFLMLCYLCAYLDRVNVGFAKLQMMNDLALSETVYGLGAGMFFIGYFLCEVPSNIILHKVGARVWIARIMITWGIVSALFAFVETAWQFYALRFLLGIAEAGLAPGLLLYLTYWFPSYRRARMTVLWFIAIPLSGMVGGPPLRLDHEPLRRYARLGRLAMDVRPGGCAYSRCRASGTELSQRWRASSHLAR